MASLRLFFSWQSDSPANTNRDFIYGCLEQAVTKTKLPLQLDEATRGVPGTPGIVGSVFSKIRESSVFVPDLTLVGEYRGERSTPNPNVILEYGFALEAVGEVAVLPVFNKFFGDVGRLPSDIASRVIRAIYDYGGGLDGREVVQERFVETLVQEIDLILDGGLLSGLGPLALEIARYLVVTSEVGAHQDPRIDLNVYMREASVEKHELWRAAEQLECRGLVEVKHYGGKPFCFLLPKDQIFWHFDRLFRGWHPEEDACQVAEILVDGPNPFSNHIRLESLCAKTGWSLRRVNPSVTWLVNRSLVGTGIDVSNPEAFRGISETARTREFVANNRHK